MEKRIRVLEHTIEHQGHVLENINNRTVQIAEDLHALLLGLGGLGGLSALAKRTRDQG